MIIKSTPILFCALLLGSVAPSVRGSFVLTNSGSGFSTALPEATATALVAIGGVQLTQQGGFYQMSGWHPAAGRYVQFTVSAPAGSPPIHLDRLSFDVRNSAMVGPSAITVYIHDSTNLSLALATNTFPFGQEFSPQTFSFGPEVTSHVASSFTIRFQVPSAINNSEGVDLDNIAVYGAAQIDRPVLRASFGQTAASIQQTGFIFYLTGSSNRYIAEYSVNFTNWFPFATNSVLTNGGQTQFRNTNTSGNAYRFYRVRRQ